MTEMETPQTDESGSPDLLPWHGFAKAPKATVTFLRTDGVWEADYGHTTVGRGQEFSDAVAAVEKWAKDRRLLLAVQGIEIHLVEAPLSGRERPP